MRSMGKIETIAALFGLVLVAPSSYGAASCTSTGSQPVASTIEVTNTTRDGGCLTYNASSALGDGSQAEGQKPIFKVTNGTLKNVILGNNGADGIHTYGNVTLENITWRDVGEDAMTVKSSGTVNVRYISGWNAADKFFQQNAASTLNVHSAYINNAKKAFRQLGGSTFTGSVKFTSSNLYNITEAVFRTDASSSTARWESGSGSNVLSVCRGYASGKCTVGSGVTGYSRVNY
jgi:pectate lyase C